MTRPFTTAPRAWRHWLMLLLGGVVASACAQTQTNRYTILTNGPTSARINVVIFSEGYTTNDLASNFVGGATSAVARLLSVQPYSEYGSYFNAFAVSVASVQSGSSHPQTGVTNNTYFNSAYDATHNYVITIPATNQPNTIGTGKIGNLLTNWVPEYNTNRDFTILLVNDETIGGSGGPLTISPLGQPVYQQAILAHETGHTLAALGDEYAYDLLDAGAGGERQNVTTNTIRSNIPWNVWISTNTPVPTPTNGAYTSVVGLFEGANYSATGWYRPKMGCLMRDLLVPSQSAPNSFCDVCTEALIKSFYSRIRPIESFSPANTNLSVVSTQAVSFSVKPLQPATHNLAVQWFTNGVAVSGATNTTFQFYPAAVGDGANTVRAVVNDPTPLVRNDPANLLRATNTWSAAVSINELSLTNALFFPDGRFSLTVTGLAPRGFVIQMSTNLVNWVSLSTNNLSGGRFDYTNSGLGNVPCRFYRAYGPP